MPFSGSGQAVSKQFRVCTSTLVNTLNNKIISFIHSRSVIEIALSEKEKNISPRVRKDRF